MQPQNIVFNGDGLHAEVTLTCEQFDVLATDRLTYDSGEIHAIENYFTAWANSGPDSNPQPPVSLVVASGGETCTADMELTNTGSSSIIVKQVETKLLAAPQENEYQYRLIDYCSLPLNGGDCYTPHGGGPECDTYSASIHLSSASVGSAFSGTPVPSDPSCPSQLTINPGPSAMILNVGFSSKNLQYSTELQLDILGLDGEKHLTLSQSPSTLIFAADSQFSCYALHSTQFSLEFQGSEAYKRTDGDNDPAHFCV